MRLLRFLVFIVAIFAIIMISKCSSLLRRCNKANVAFCRLYSGSAHLSGQHVGYREISGFAIEDIVEMVVIVGLIAEVGAVDTVGDVGVVEAVEGSCVRQNLSIP